MDICCLLSGKENNEDQKCDFWQISILSLLNIKFSTLKSDLVDWYCEINICYWQNDDLNLKQILALQSP